MIYIILIWLVPAILSITICYFDSKKYHHTMKHFLEECLIALFLFPISILFLISKFGEYLEIKFTFQFNTDFITKFLNKRL